MKSVRKQKNQGMRYQKWESELVEVKSEKERKQQWEDNEHFLKVIFLFGTAGLKFMQE